MTSAPPPYPPPPQPPYAQQPGVPVARPPKERPSAGWLVLGLGVFLAGAAIATGAFVWLFVGLFDFDTLIEADGTTNLVTVGTDRDRMLWMDSTTQTCTVVDRSTGEPIRLRPVDGSYSRSQGGDDFEGLLRFDPGSGRIEITCTQTDGTAPGPVMVSAVPRLDNIAGAVAIASIAGLLSLVGLVIVLWTGILWSLRPARPRGW